MSDEVWIKVLELGFRRHSANTYVVIKRYKRKTGYGVYEKTRSYNGYWNGRKLGEFEDFKDVACFLENYNGMWSVEEERLKKALEKEGWFLELEEVGA